MSTESREPAPLRSASKQLLARYGASGDIPDAVFARGLQRVQQRQRAAVVQRRNTTLVSVAAAVAIAAAVVAMLVAPGYIRQRDVDARRDQAVYGQRVDAPRSAEQANPQGPASGGKSPPLAERESTTKPEPLAPQPGPPKTPTRSAPSPRTSKATRSARPPTDDADDASSSSLAEERVLLRTAWSALARDDLSAAQAQAAQHRRRFPDGALAAERRALVAIVACRRDDQNAKAVAQRYLADHAGDLLTGQVRGACAAILNNNAAP